MNKRFEIRCSVGLVSIGLVVADGLRKSFLLGLLAWAFGFTAGAVSAAQDDHREKAVSALAEMSIEELVNVTVTSVSRKEQKASEAPAAITA